MSHYINAVIQPEVIKAEGFTDRSYVFSEDFGTKDPDQLRKDFEPVLPEFIPKEVLAPVTFQFAVGRANSGAPVHYHDTAINSLFAGRKLWIIFPPEDAVVSNLHTLDLIYAVVRSSPSYPECLQRRHWQVCAGVGRGGNRTHLPDHSRGLRGISRCVVLRRLIVATAPLSPCMQGNGTGARFPLFSQPPLRCIQEAGDQLFIPEKYAHATVNLDTSVSVAVEYLPPSLWAMYEPVGSHAAH